VQLTSAYNKRETVQSLAYGLGTQKLWSKQYNWYPNQDLQLITDAISGVQRQFTYDNVNRLRSAVDLAGTTQSSGETTATSDETEANKLESSQQLGGPGWSASSASLAANATAAPDGTQTAGVVTASAGATDSFIQDVVGDPALYDGAGFTGSVWLKVPSGTLATYIFIVETGDQGFSLAETPVTLTTTWQQFTVSGTLQNGLTSLAMQIGGGNSIQNGKVYDIWGPELGPGSANGTVVTNILPSSEQVTGPSWVINSGSVQQRPCRAGQHQYRCDSDRQYRIDGHVFGGLYTEPVAI
jgi:hypothetical protein